MRFYITLYLVLFIGIQAQAGKKLRVLFIGNSYTYVNSMPQIVANIATTMSDTLVWDMAAPGGQMLSEHVNDPATRLKIQAGNWHYVVLQEQSQLPALPDDWLENMIATAKRLDSLIKVYNPCSETMFYMTWGRKNKDAGLCNLYSGSPYNWPHFCTYRAMDSVIRLRYRMMADSSRASVSPVGAVWRYVRTNYPSIELYDADESHPAPAGSYAAACSFYTALFKKDPSLITYNYSIPATDAANIRTAVKKVTYDSLFYWHIDQYRTEARFTHTITASTASFTGNTTNATGRIWYFGDGQTATIANPVHTYSIPGNYRVMLVANNNTTGCSDTAYALLNINTSSVNATNAGGAVFTLSPNPAGDFMHVNAAAFLSGSYQISLVNSLGQTVHEQQSLPVGQQVIDLSSYGSGMYFLSVAKAGNVVYRGKIVKR